MKNYRLLDSSRSMEKVDEEEISGRSDEGNCRPRGPIERGRKGQTAEIRDDGDGYGEKNHMTEAARKPTSDGGGERKNSDHEDGSDNFDEEDDGNGDKAEEDEIEPLDGKPLEIGLGFIETDGEKRAVEDESSDDDEEIEPREEEKIFGARPEDVAKEKGGDFDVVARGERKKEGSNGHAARPDCADDGVFPFAAGEMDPADEIGGEEGKGQRSVEGVEPREVELSLEEEAEAHPSKDRVGDAAADEDDPFHDDVRTDDATGDGSSKSRQIGHK